MNREPRRIRPKVLATKKHRQWWDAAALPARAKEVLRKSEMGRRVLLGPSQPHSKDVSR